MILPKKQLLLYAVTDQTGLSGSSFLSQIEAVLQGGVTMLQLREKGITDDAFIEKAIAVKAICGKYHVPLIINDNVSVAVASGADGVHLGQKDMPVEKARTILGEEKIIGVSARTIEQAVKAEQNGADYLGCGAVFSTSTKLDAVSLPHVTLQKICSSVSIPVVAIGGISAANALQLTGSGISGIAVVSALFSNENPESAAAELKQLAKLITKRSNENK